MRHNLLFDAAALSSLVSLGAIFAAYLFSRRLWRSPLAWLCLLLVATIIYGVTCSYARLYQTHQIFEIVVSRLSTWVGAWRHAAAAPPWRLAQISTTQLQKDGHVVLFAMLSVVFGLLVWQRHRHPLHSGPRPWWRPCIAYLAVFASLTLFAAATELLQYATPEREPKVADWLLNLKGLGIGVLLVCVFLGLVDLGQWLFSRRRRRAPVALPRAPDRGRPLAPGPGH